MLITKADWITALTKAKKEALRLYPNRLCIHDAGRANGIYWWSNVIREMINCTTTFTGNCHAYMLTNPTRAEVAAVFDRSIEAIRRG